MKNKQKSMGIALALASICFLEAASFAQPANCKDTTSNVLNLGMMPFVLSITEKNVHTVYWAEVSMAPSQVKKEAPGGEGPASPLPSVQYFQATATLCDVQYSNSSSLMPALSNKRVITDPALLSKMRQVLSEQLALLRDRVLEEEKR